MVSYQTDLSLSKPTGALSQRLSSNLSAAQACLLRNSLTLSFQDISAGQQVPQLVTGRTTYSTA